MATPAAVLWGINAAAYAIAAGDDDDSWVQSLSRYVSDPAYRERAQKNEELEREHLPPWMKGTTALLTPKTLRLGMDEVTKLPLFIDVSRIIPGGDLFDISPNAGGIPLPQPITPSHPLFTTAVAMLGNKDLFLGKDLTDSNYTSGEKAEKRLAWLYQPGWKMMRGGEIREAASAPSPSPATSSNTPSTTQTWKCTCSFRLEPNRWIKATAPMCSTALSTCAAPGLWDCRLWAMTRRKMRSTMFSTAPSRCIK
jgi:hypothetical protein